MKLTGALGPGRIVRVILGVVKADEGNGVVHLVGRVVDAPVRIASQHLETFGEGHDLLSLRARTLQVAVAGSSAIITLGSRE